MDAMHFRQVLPKLLPAAVLGGHFESLASHWLGLNYLCRKYESLQGARDLPERMLASLAVSWHVADSDLRHIPPSGAAVVIANHPFGLLEGAILAAVLHKIRPDVKILANDILRCIPELANVVIPVDPMPSKSAANNYAGMRKALHHLRAGGLLVVFPAGEVSHFQWTERETTDPAWNASVVRLVKLAAKCVVIPVFMEGTNSLLFHAAGVFHPRLRTALLGRELINKRGTNVALNVGSPIDSAKLQSMPSDQDCIDYLRWRTYLLRNRRSFKPRTAWPLKRNQTETQEPISQPVCEAQLSIEIDSLPSDCQLETSGDLAVYLSAASQIPNVLLEIGRLRETTFRAAGEGTGKSVDLDTFDQHYQHLFVWNSKKHELVGAYRLCTTDQGPARLYTNTLFNFGRPLLDQMGPAIELGRSFVRAEYQRGFAPLLLLWKGIGKVVARSPQCKTLFGPVSISNQYQAISRQLMISFLERSASLHEWKRFIHPKNEPYFKARTMLCSDVDELSEVVSDIEARDVAIPVLLRQYLKLGGKLLGFNVDPEFANALDGLIVVDLTRTEPKLLSRCLGRTEAARFLEYHNQKGQNGTQ